MTAATEAADCNNAQFWAPAPKTLVYLFSSTPRGTPQQHCFGLALIYCSASPQGSNQRGSEGGQLPLPVTGASSDPNINDPKSTEQRLPKATPWNTVFTYTLSLPFILTFMQATCIGSYPTKAWEKSFTRRKYLLWRKKEKKKKKEQPLERAEQSMPEITDIMTPLPTFPWSYFTVHFTRVSLQ